MTSGFSSSLIPDVPLSNPIVNAQAYTNPLQIALADGTDIESCPDPSIIHGQAPGDTFWYMYCTNEIFHDGSPLHLIPISKSQDLVHWSYAGDAFQQMPGWVAPDGGLWAPDVQYFNAKYYLYYAVSNTTLPGSAIFVATSDTPTGPWIPNPAPVVAPGAAPCCSGLRKTIDPAGLALQYETSASAGSSRAHELSPTRANQILRFS